MSEKLTFDNLAYGTHFQDEAGRRFIKLDTRMSYGLSLPCYYDECYSRVWFNAVDYGGIPVNVPFDVKCEVIVNFNQTLDNSKNTDIIISDSNKNSQQKNKNMNTPTTIPQLSLKDAVVNAVNSLKVNKGNFSAHDVTVAVRESVNAGEIALPGLETAQPNRSSIKYWVNHSDVRAIIDDLLNDGTLATLGLTNVNYDGGFRVFEFSTPVPSADDHDGAPTPDTTAAAPTVPAPAVSVAAAPVSPIVSLLSARIDAYMSKVGSATLKQIQSALKVNGVTCKDLADIVTNLGYTLMPGTPDCFSTYVAA
jgi:hypothetical protein